MQHIYFNEQCELFLASMYVAIDANCPPLGLAFSAQASLGQAHQMRKTSSLQDFNKATPKGSPVRTEHIHIL